MDDLSGIDWSAKPKANQAALSNPSYPSLLPSPSPFGTGSGRSTPASNASSSQFAKPPASKAAQDSFSNLVNFASAKPAQTLTLAERQAQLEAEKKKKEEDKKKLYEAQFGSSKQWDSFGAGSSTGTSSPAIRPPPSAKQDEDDLFAAFNKDTKVDKSSHYPPPESKPSTPSNANPLDLTNPTAWGGASAAMSKAFDEDDDPFGLSEMKPTAAPAPSKVAAADDDDFLGDLAKPVEEVRRNRPVANATPEPGKPIEDGDSTSEDELPAAANRRTQQKVPPKGSSDPFDRTVAQLVDYGFSPEDARRGVLESGAGTNVQAVANWLLDDAHRKAKEKAQGRSGTPASGDRQRPEPTRQTRAEPDFAKSAAAVGSSLFKTANSLWKTGQKKVQQAVADFQAEGGGDPNQPKWMRDAQMNQSRHAAPGSSNGTDEAAMLDAGRPKPTKESSRNAPIQRTSSPALSSANTSRSSSMPRWQQQTPAASMVSDARSKLSRFNDDDDFAINVSAGRRKKPASPAPAPAEEPNLLFETGSKQSAPAPSRTSQLAAAPTQRKMQPPAPVARRPDVPSRQIPTISPVALQTSNKNRQEGTAHFKRGDYAAAHASYTAAVSSVPPSHPLIVVLLTNRALTALKTGEPKQAVIDADEAMKVIGPGKGQGETVSVTGESGNEEKRDMRELYGKALSRKAEALEQMEKWADAGAVWKICVEEGLGGATAIKGRQRCQAALAPKPKPAPKPAKAKLAPSAGASLAPQKDSEAVTRLREANKASAKEDDEKFALADKVDARVAAWRDGKRDNLRALVASLDKVLWEGSGWKTVGLHELVMANKVKISYMKAIAKTHPDKLAQDASTEVKLIAGIVFSTLNEAWDKFKAENGL